MFDRVAAINLDRRRDRWEAFCDRLPRPWPLPAIERFAAIDGSRQFVPTSWECGPGAYGCLLSHCTLWQQAAEDDASLLVFEDDAVFCDNFAEKLAAFLVAVPDDWQMLYLGGAHILPPESIGGEVLRCLGVKKTHAYAVRGELLTRLPPILTRKTLHIDVSLSLLHHNFRVYAPAQWLCGQAAGRSDILVGSRGEPERWFDGRAA